MADEESEVEFLQNFKGDHGGIAWFFAAAEGGCDFGLVAGGGEDCLGHVFDEDAFSLDIRVSIC